MARKYYVYNEQTCEYQVSSGSSPVKYGARLGLLSLALLASVLLANFLIERGLDPEMLLMQHQQKQILGQLASYNEDFKEIEERLNRVHKNDQTFYKSILNKEPIDPSVWEAGIGGNRKLFSIDPPLLRELKVREQKIDFKLRLQKKSFEETHQVAKQKTLELKHIPAIKPMSGGMSSGFGYRSNPFHGGHYHFHAGVDIVAPIGTPVKGAGDGVVVKAGAPERGYGYQVEIDHGYGFRTKYAHLSKINVRIGQQVKRGDVVGLCGSTGYSTGPHLHYEVIKNGTTVNPLNYYPFE